MGTTRFPILAPNTDERQPHPSYIIEWWNARQWWLLRASDTFLVAAIIGVLFLDLPNDAQNVAETARAASDTADACEVTAIGAPTRLFELDLLTVRAIPATFAVDSLPPGVLAGGQTPPFSGLYLGSADGLLIVYQKQAHRILKVPSNGVTVVIDANMKGCPGTHGPNER
jgi:hypothetical protein